MKKRSVILSALLVIALCVCLISGATYALFTSESKVNIAVTSGKVQVEATVENLALYSMDRACPQYFENGGTASYDNGVLTLNKMTPGDKVTFDIKIVNKSNVDIQYKVSWEVSGDIAGGLVATADGKELSNVSWKEWKATAIEKELVIDMAVELPLEAGNEYQDKKWLIVFTVEAVQGNAPLVDTWDGEADTTWYFENPTASEYSIDTAEALVGLSQLVDGTAVIPVDANVTLPGDFDGVTFKLESDIDLYLEDANGEPVPFEPIGSYRNDLAFRGEFDGQGHTISNLSQNTWQLNNGYYYGDLGMGLFSCIENATIKNLTIDGADISGESGLCGTVAATAFGDCKFENITIKNANVADYQYYAGGIVGWASGNHEYVNCVIDESTTVAGQWGDFDCSIGGVIGGASGSAQILIKDTTVACRIDAYNDVTSSYQWYAYRRAGMLIGNSGKTVTNASGTTIAAAPQLTCENVTVIYGEWADYTYCEFAGTSWPYVRVQAGVSNSAYSNPRYGHPTDANGNEVVDDNHVHNAGEDHFIICAFDQLYGGGQGVYGASSHEGVTVVYNNPSKK